MGELYRFLEEPWLFWKTNNLVCMVRKHELLVASAARRRWRRTVVLKVETVDKLK